MPNMPKQPSQKTSPAIILASGSPRRKQLLEQVGVSCGVQPVHIDESPQKNENPKDYVLRMAQEKSEKAQATLGYDKIIITADTIGQVAERENPSNMLILVKPTSKVDAFTIWQQLSGRKHEVLTAVCVAYREHRLLSCVKTEVEFISLTQEMMQDYWQTGEPADKAGAYAIQGRGGAWVKAIYGSYANVVGLPLVETLAMLEDIVSLA